jgi:methionyl-tRNA formyltransferase
VRLVFAGTPEVAVPSLEALVASSHEVVAVLTRPDARSGRGRTLVPSPVRVRAEALGLEVLTPPRAGDPGFRARLAELAPDACPIVAYGGLIPPAVLSVPPAGWVNLHFSLLPAWRGAAPVQHAVMAGDEVTGATTFRLEEGLDTGPTYGVMTETIRPTDTAGDLLQRLSTAGAGLLVATLDGLQSGTLQAVPQPGEGISHAPKITVEDARVRWDRPALAVDRQVRGCTPAPGAWSTFRGERLKLLPVAPVGDGPAAAPGEIVADRRAVHVGTATGAVRLGTVQPHGRKPMAAADWARGVRPDQGEKLGDD